MAKRAVIWLAAYIGGLALSVTDPFLPLMSYLLDYYNHPPLRWWGDELPDLRWSLIAALVLLGAYLLHGRSLLDNRIFRHSITWWLLGFLGIALLVTPFLAVDEARSIEYSQNLAKLVLLYCLIVGTVRTPTQYRLFVLAMIVGAMFWGFDAWQDPKRQAGRLQAIGGPDTYNDNSAASHLLTTLPFAVLYFWSAGWRRRLFGAIAILLLLNTIVLCNSRGATVALVASAAAGVALAGRGRRLVLAGSILAGGFLVASLSDAPFLERQAGILDGAEDSSAQQRLDSWQGAMQLVSDHPLGVGGGGFDALSPVYIPGIVELHEGEQRAVHNTYLWIASDWGVPGLVCFVGVIVATFVTLFKTRRIARDAETINDCVAMQVALIAFLVSAFFINRMYGEIFYWLAALAAARRNIAEGAWAEQTVPAAETTTARGEAAAA
jgi:O-antigen ligase